MHNLGWRNFTVLFFTPHSAQLAARIAFCKVAQCLYIVSIFPSNTHTHTRSWRWFTIEWLAASQVSLYSSTKSSSFLRAIHVSSWKHYTPSGWVGWKITKRSRREGGGTHSLCSPSSFLFSFNFSAPNPFSTLSAWPRKGVGAAQHFKIHQVCATFNSSFELFSFLEAVLLLPPPRVCRHVTLGSNLKQGRRHRWWRTRRRIHDKFIRDLFLLFDIFMSVKSFQMKVSINFAKQFIFPPSRISRLGLI